MGLGRLWDMNTNLEYGFASYSGWAEFNEVNKEQKKNSDHINKELLWYEEIILKIQFQVIP